MKILINRCYGGFGLAEPVLNEYAARAHRVYETYNDSRTDPIMIQIVEEFLAAQKPINGMFANVEICVVPDGAFWHIEEYDGTESLWWSESEIHHV